jgi:hypothetical protein
MVYMTISDACSAKRKINQFKIICSALELIWYLLEQQLTSNLHRWLGKYHIKDHKLNHLQSILWECNLNPSIAYKQQNRLNLSKGLITINIYRVLKALLNASITNKLKYVFMC